MERNLTRVQIGSETTKEFRIESIRELLFGKMVRGRHLSVNKQDANNERLAESGSATKAAENLQIVGEIKPEIRVRE